MNTIPLAEPEPTSGGTASLAWVQGLLASESTGAIHLTTLLPELARTFQATHVGLAGLVDGIPVVRRWLTADGRAMAPVRWPWDEQTGLLAQVLSSQLAVESKTSAGTFLLAAGGAQEDAGWLLFLEGGPPSLWSREDRASLQLAAFALERLLPPVRTGARSRWHERVRLHQRLEDAAVIVGRMAHEFGNVLTGILGFTELSLAQVVAGTPLHQFLIEVHQSSQQGARLTTALKQFSQRSGARGRPTDLAAVVAEEEIRRRQQWGRGITLQTSIPADLPPVALDAEPLRQLLGHLLENAREAIAGDGTVRITARVVELTEKDCQEPFGNPLPGTFLEVGITDTGTGFTPEAKRRVLVEPFYSTKPRHRGLGLASIYGLLHANRGALSLEHPAQGGTVVRCLLPVATAAAVPVRAEPVEVPAAKPRRERLLVVDDDPQSLRLMCSTLERAGYYVLAAADGAQALEAHTASREPIHLVLSDVVMPRMTGFDLARQLLRTNPNVNVLFTSGHIPLGFVQEDFAGHDFELLPKPFRPEGLLRAVRTALDRERRPWPAPSSKC